MLLINNDNCYSFNTPSGSQTYTGTQKFLKHLNHTRRIDKIQ